MANADKTRLIEAYYRGILKGEDKTYFKQLMKENASFKQEVKEYKKIFQGFEALHIEAFENNLMQFEAKHQSKTDNVVVMRPFRKFYAAAAAIALLICATFAYNVMMPSVFDQQFHASQSIAVHMESLRGDNTMSTAEQIKKNAFTAYQQKKYGECISFLTDYQTTYPEAAAKDYQSILVLGVAQLASGDTETALSNLDIVVSSKDSAYKQEAEWMWALAQVKLGAHDKAQPVLEKIAKHKGHIHKEDATVTLKAIQ